MASVHQRRNLWIRVRILILCVAMLTGAVAVARGAWDLGVTRRDELRSEAESRLHHKMTLAARRGMITDRHGEEMAIEVKVDSVSADPRKLTNAAQAAALLSPILDIDETALRAKLSSRRHFVWLKRQVSSAIGGQVRTLGIEGINLVKENKRFYPNLSFLASHIIGFTGVDSNGLEGIELKFENQLRYGNDGGDGFIAARGAGRTGSTTGAPIEVGNTIELTIDRTLQYIVEQELAATVRTFEARAGQAVVMDPQSGEILALANWPTFNPNGFRKSTAEQRRNRVLLDVFEPGSTFKVFTLAAALNSGAVRPDDLIFCERGRLVMHDVVIHDDHRDGWLNPTQCLEQSSNICFAKIAEKLGKKRFYHYLRRFGFGDRTEVFAPFEMRGTLHHFKKWYDIDRATIAFGQGVGVTGLQMTTALSAVANGGVLMRPQLVKRIVSPDKRTVRTFSPTPRRRVISRYTARLVADMMTAVTEPGGTGTEAALDGFLVAGKTGTAQKSDGSRGYHDEKWVASFVGFIPANRPRLVISVVIDEPMISHYGGTVAAPALRRIADQSLRYLGVSPRQDTPKAKPRKTGSPPAQSPRTPAADNDERLSSEAEQALEPEAERPLAEDQVRVPNIHGMTVSAALDSLAEVGLRPLLVGTGIAVDQLPPSGDPLDKGEFVQVNFEPLPGGPAGEQANAIGR